MSTGQHLDQSSSIEDRTGPLLIVGLGNPGSKYKANRHNIGFMAIDRFAEAETIKLGRVQSQAIVGKGFVGKQSVILAKPQTFMNRSGNSVNQLVRFYKLPLESVLVVYDELDLPLGTLRLRQKGGSGGHNGMKSIINHLGNDFPRLRLGIGRPPGQMDPAAYVLQDFRAKELPAAIEMLENATAAIKSFIELGVDIAMTQHNKK